MGRTLVTGAAGYLGMVVATELRRLSYDVTALDCLLHGQRERLDELREAGVRVVEGDVRDPEARAAALEDVDAVVHLAAIVGDPACARAPELAQEVNVDAALALVGDAAIRDVERFVMASTCSNYGRMADPTHPIDESGTLAPVSLYAEQKVAVEQHLLALEPPAPAVTCLRFATLYGEAPRMRFDLTVNEFTRDLWAARTVEVYGRQFWRPYVHVRDAAHAIELVLTAPVEDVAGEIFNVGDSHENYRKLEIVEQIHRQIDRGRVVYVERDEDPRDYKVSFDKIARALDYSVTMRVPDGISELIDALDAGRFPDAFDPRYSNIA